MRAAFLPTAVASSQPPSAAATAAAAPEIPNYPSPPGLVLSVAPPFLLPSFLPRAHPLSASSVPLIRVLTALSSGPSPRRPRSHPPAHSFPPGSPPHYLFNPTPNPAIPASLPSHDDPPIPLPPSPPQTPEGPRAHRTPGGPSPRHHGHLCIQLLAAVVQLRPVVLQSPQTPMVRVQRSQVVSVRGACDRIQIRGVLLLRLLWLLWLLLLTRLLHLEGSAGRRWR